jgi:hypothetical protein
MDADMAVTPPLAEAFEHLRESSATPSAIVTDAEGDDEAEAEEEEAEAEAEAQRNTFRPIPPFRPHQSQANQIPEYASPPPDPEVIGSQNADTEHEEEVYEYPAFIMETPVHLRERIREFLNVLGAPSEGRDSDEIKEKLEELLHATQEAEVAPNDTIPINLDTPMVVLLAQYRCFRICRKEVFCPAERCEKAFGDIGKLATHLRKAHSATAQATSDMVRYFIQNMLAERIHGKLITRQDAVLQC